MNEIRIPRIIAIPVSWPKQGCFASNKFPATTYTSNRTKMMIAAIAVSYSKFIKS